VPITADNLPDDLTARKRIIAAMAQDALSAQAEIARLKFPLARYRRAEFGGSSEKLAREAEQLELALEALETDPGGATGDGIAGGRCSRRDRSRSAAAGAAPIAGTPAEKGSAPSCTVHLSWLRRRAAQDRRRSQRDPRLRAGSVQSRPADSRETVVPGLRHGSRRAGAGARIARRAGAGLLAHIVVSKYDDHCVSRTHQQRWRCGAV